MENEKKSIVKEALVDYKTIQEAADANAKKRLAEEFPDKFSNILKEELNKNKSAKESKKLDESEQNKDNVMKNLTKETVQVTKTIGDSKPFGEKPKGVAKVQEDVKITDTVGDSAPFDEKAKGVAKVQEDVKITDTVGKPDPFTEKAKKGAVKIDEERDKDFTGDLEAKTPNQGKGAAAKGNAFTEKIKGPSSGKPMPNLKEDFNITELDASSVGSALENAGQEDEVLTMEQIEEEIASMEGLGEELGDVSAATPPAPQPQAGAQTGTPDVAMNELVAMRDRLNEIINGGGMDEMHAAGKESFGSDSQIATLHNQGPTDKLIDEESPITDDDINAVLGGGAGGEAPVEEAHGVTYPNRRNNVGRHLPAPDYLSTGEKDQSPEYVLKESKKKIGVLIEENKKLTKKLNETKEYKKTVTSLVESYKSALDKYRGQLKEMAIFNTNLAHVNNLLVNEELALTQEDKIKIINEFKKVDNITASKKVYDSMLTEMKTSKKTLTESVQDKVSASIQPSSKQKLDEVIEKTAYADDKHINRMKVLIESMEKRGKKKII